MRFAKGMDVYMASGEKVGALSRVVIDAKTKDVTDLVVEGGGLSPKEKVIPVGLVDLQNEGRITLRETNQGIDDFMDYETPHYVPVDRMDDAYQNMEVVYRYPPADFQMPTSGLLPGSAPDHVIETDTSIPQGRVVISEGAQVISVDDKHIGNVEQVIADSKTHNMSHFVVGKGFLLKAHKLVPAQWVNKVSDGKIYLSVEARLFDRLPDYQKQ
jgi:uncharacterized protein YrrD